MNAVIFPGQGAQYIGMGKGLYDNFSQAQELFSHIDGIVGFSLSDKCFLGPQEDLKNTSLQQLAILATSVIAFEIFKEKNAKIDYFSGLSLGEYACLYPAGVLSLDDVVKLVKERGLAMEEASKINPSCMFAVIGLDGELLREKQNLGFCIANINSKQQIVVSLSKDNKLKVKEELLKLGAKVVELEVSGGFHSSFMEVAKARLEKTVSGMAFSDAKIPIVSNFTAKGHTDKEEIKNNLINQLTHTVLWKDCIEFMGSKGVDIFFEVGPSRTLKGLMRKINPQLKVINIEKKDDLDNL